MDDPTIIKLFENQEKNLKEFIGVSMSLNRAKVINELDPIRDQLSQIVEQNKVRNHRIEGAEEEIERVEHKFDDKCVEIRQQTFVARWVQKHPLASAIVLLAIVMGGAFAYHNINFKKTVENKTGIVIEQPIEE